MTVGNDLVITPNANLDGIAVVVSGSGTSQIIVESGVSITTSGSQADGAQISGSGDVNVGIQFDGNMNGSFAANASPTSPTSAAFAQITDAAGTGSVTVSQGADSSVELSGDESVAINAYQAGLGAATSQAAGDIEIAGDAVFGVHAWINNSVSEASLLVEQAAGSTITVSGNLSAGVYGLHSGLGDITVNTAGQISVTGENSAASLAGVDNGDSTGAILHNVTSSAQISVTGTNAAATQGNAVFTYTVGLNASTTNVAGTLISQGAHTRGIDVIVTNADNDAQQIARLTGDGAISTNGEGSYGISITNAGTGLSDIGLSGNADIQTNGAGAHGVNIEGGGASVIVTGATTQVRSNGLGAAGMRSLTVGDNDMTVNGTVSSSGENGAGLFAASSAGAANIVIASTASVVGGWDNGAQPSNALPYAVAAGVAVQSADGSRIQNAGTISAGSDRAIFDLGRLNGAAGPLTVDNNRLVTGYVQFADVTANQFINAAGAEFATRHFADSDGDGTREVKRVAISDFGGDASLFSNAGLVRLAPVAAAATTDAAGYYIPTTGSDSRALESSVYNLNRSDVVQAQFVNLARFEHSGVLDLRGAEVGNTLVMTANGAAGGAAGDGLFVANGGQLLLNAVIGEGIAVGGQTGNQADMLIVDGTSLGSAATQIFVGQAANSLGAATPGNGIQLVEVRNKDASEAGVFTLGAPVAAGAFQYGLFHNGVAGDSDDGNWYLRAAIADPDTEEEFLNYRPLIPTITVVPALAQRLGLDLLGNYHDRQGEDYADWLPRSAAQSGVPSDGHSGRKTAMWARVFGSDGDVDYRRNSVSQQANGFARYGAAYDYETIAFQLGFDLLRKTNDKGARNIMGVYGGLGEIEARVDAVYGGASGRVRLDGYHLGLYFTHKSADGTYIDAVLQGTRYKSKAWDNSGYQSRTDGWGYAASLEAGVPFTLSEGWRLEPQAQIVYQQVKMDDTADALALYDYRKSDALWGRLGLRMTNQWARQSGLSNMVWARFNVWHDFGRDAEVRVSNLGGQSVTPLFTSLGGTWGQGQLALSSEMARNVSAFASADYNFSFDKMKSDAFGGRIGLKFVW